MDKDTMEEYRQIQQRKYDEFKKKEKRKSDIQILKDLNYDDLICNKVMDNNCVEVVQNFFRKYRLANKLCVNYYNIIDSKDEDIIRFRHGNKIYGYHYLTLDYFFNENGYFNPFNDIELENYAKNRIIKHLNIKNKYKYESHSEYHSFDTVSFNYSDFWNPAEIYGLFESRGINSVEVPENIFNEMIDLPPSLYAIEIINNNSPNRGYAAFDDFPSKESVQLPIGIYHQLKMLPKDCDSFKMRIIEPPKGTMIKIRCMINKENLLEDVKGKLTSEINKHKILSLNQLIVVESDINFGMIPFKIEYLEPSNVISIADVDIEVDFLDCLNYEDPMESLLIELNK